MAVDSLAELKSVFEKWRSERAHIRVPVPQTLIGRAVRSTAVHGRVAVREATRIPSRHLLSTPEVSEQSSARRVDRPKKSRVEAVPAFSRVELSAPNASSRPIAELETPLGMKLRIFAATAETLVVIKVLCGKGDSL